MKNCYVENDFLVCFCGKCKPEDYKLPSDYLIMTSQTPEVQAYHRGYKQGKFDAEMDRLNITPDTTEIEEVVDAITKDWDKQAENAMNGLKK